MRGESGMGVPGGMAPGQMKAQGRTEVRDRVGG